MTDVLERVARALADRYRIERELGQGGMATVYLAEDLKHEREVALKVLRPELAAVLGADRFVQEIKTTAALQHPHILPLFDSGEADGFLFYVMPYVEGETLRDTLNRETQLSVDEAVRITTEVADALDYAHRHGVVHRDIKPENILLHDGRPMVADFGIALALSAAAGGRMTETGMSLGTPHYMSPEQATADKDITGKSDIYSLASVLYEMLTGEPPHTGSSAQAIIMKIIAEDVKPVTTLRKSVPPNVAAAVTKALEKVPADRFETAKAFADALADPHFALGSGAVGAGALAPSGLHRWRAVALAAMATSAVLVVVSLWSWLRPQPAPRATEQEIVLGSVGSAPGTVEYGTAIAPDGSAIVYWDTNSAGQLQLLLKERDRLAPRVLAALRAGAGTGIGIEPSFSPDGRSIAYGDGKLYRVSRSGGAPIVLSDSSIAGAPAWLDDGTIISIAAGGQGLFATPASGGPTKRVLMTNGANGTIERVSAVPGADAVLVTLGGGGRSEALLLDLHTDSTRVLQQGAFGAWVVGRWLLFIDSKGALFGVPFDRHRLAVSGTPVALLDSIQINSFPQANQAGDITIAANGTILYTRTSPLAGATGLRLVRVSLDGSAEPLDAAASVRLAGLGGLDLSPDGRSVAVSVEDSTSGHSDIYVFDLRGGPPTRITFTGTTNIRPEWSPDGRRIMYVSNAGGGGALRLWAKPAGGGGAPVLLTGIRGIFGGEWSPDGQWIVYRTDAGVTGNRDILAIRTHGDTTPVPLATTPAAELGPALSPDGHWLAYSSDRNGTDQVFVQPFPKAGGDIWQVSSGSGFAPQWSHDGRRLFYQNGRAQMIAADVGTSPTFHVVRETVLFSGARYLAYEYYHEYAVAPDDRHFIMLELPPAAMGRGARVIEMAHWLPAALGAHHE